MKLVAQVDLQYLGLCSAAIVVVGWYLWRLGVRHAKRYEAEERVEQGKCTHCGYDLRAGHDRCPECGEPIPPSPEEAAAGEFDVAALRDGWPAAPITPRAPATAESLVILRTIQSRWVTDLLADHLRQRGVWCRIERNRGADAARLIVPAADEPLAREILDRLRKSPPAVPHTPEDVERSRQIPETLRGSVYRYDDPFAPAVPIGDWNAENPASGTDPLCSTPAVVPRDGTDCEGP